MREELPGRKKSDSAEEDQNQATLRRLEERARIGMFPLSSAQARLWFLHQLFPQTSAYNVPQIFEVRGALRVDVLTRSFDAIVQRHEVLRTCIGEFDGVPEQSIAESVPSIVRCWDSTDQSGDEVTALLAGEAKRPFDLSDEPLMRVVVLKKAAQQYLLMIVFHHLACDLWSLDIINRELAILYAAGCRGLDANLPPKSTSYLDFALWQHLRGHNTDQMGYWRDQLAGLEPLQLRTDFPRPEIQNGRAGMLPVNIPPITMDRLEALGRRHDATLFMVLLSGLALLLHRLTDQDDFAVGVPVAGRSHSDLEDVVGFFVNTLAMRLQPTSQMTVSELLAHVREVSLSAYRAGDVPFEKIIEELQLKRDLSRSPLVQILLTVQTAPVRPLQFGDVDLKPISMDLGNDARFDLEFILWPRQGDTGFGGLVYYDKNLFEPSTIEGIWNCFSEVLNNLPVDDQEIGKLRVLPDQQRRRILNHLGSGNSRPSAERNMLTLLMDRAKENPDRIAVQHGNEHLSYSALHCAARSLAGRLVSVGVGPEVRVGIFLNRSTQLIKAILAVLYAGGAYTLLDPSHRSGRTDREVAGCSVLMTDRYLSEKTRAESIPWIDVDEPTTAHTRPGVPTLSPENLLYVVYTSGSTGTPRGVSMPHRVILNLVEDQQRALGEAGRTLQFASLGFDVASQEILQTLASGGTLVLLSEEQRRDPVLLLPLLRRMRIERLFLPCTLLKELTSSAVESDPYLPDLTQIITAGEQLVMAPSIEAVLRANPQCSLINQYGPAETHVVSSYTLPSDARIASSPPIGRPLENHNLYVTDARLGLVPVGVAGEICAGGVAVSRGYANLPAETAAKFLPDPFSKNSGARIYRTGDLARWRSDGHLEFLGRADGQIKVQGYRVEPQEVEAVLSAHPAVRDCAVTAIGSESASRRLVAAVVVESPVTEEDLIAFARSQLPGYMIPSRAVIVDALPLTPSGKLHRAQIGQLFQQPPWDLSTVSRSVQGESSAQREGVDIPESQQGGSGAPAPAHFEGMEGNIARVWAEVLGIDTVPARASFFDLGGTSLTVIRLQRQLRASLQLEVSVAEIFKYSSLRELAQYLSRPIETRSSPVGNASLQRRSQLQKEAMRIRSDRARTRR